MLFQHITFSKNYRHILQIAMVSEGREGVNKQNVISTYVHKRVGSQSDPVSSPIIFYLNRKRFRVNWNQKITYSIHKMWFLKTIFFRKSDQNLTCLLKIYIFIFYWRLPLS